MVLKSSTGLFTVIVNSSSKSVLESDSSLSTGTSESSCNDIKRDKQITFYQIGTKGPDQRVLGVGWNPKADLFHFSVRINFSPRRKKIGTGPGFNINQIPLGGGLGIYTYRDSRSIFLGFEFRKSVFFWVLVIAAVFFWFSIQCCIFKCFMSSMVFLGPLLFTRYFSKHRSSFVSSCS